MIIKRRRLKQTHSLEERLAKDTAQLLQQTKLLPDGAAKEHLMKRIQQNEAAVHVCELLRSPQFQPAK
ncbi:hypothetical protein [Bradyrhizobium sp. sBnM-33]|uniref:hypothetical protein n=1 Tax=Bradyrhizobium sp. sBnM-33 TaxID=2831780 RepID=UPI001BCC3D80|nr:hypothetical protein [Bradyrhizobium sp. sBnM-33]WOH53536.1 hypothetical protein RX328_16465 [Bradyrhizobium sp. sBnM-33]